MGKKLTYWESILQNTTKLTKIECAFLYDHQSLNHNISQYTAKMIHDMENFEAWFNYTNYYYSRNYLGIASLKALSQKSLSFPRFEPDREWVLIINDSVHSIT